MPRTRKTPKVLITFIKGTFLVLHPVFLIPFVAGAAYSYLYPQFLPSPLQAFAEGEAIVAPPKDDDNDMVDLGSPRRDQARADADSDKKKKLPASGVLSQTFSSGTTGASIPGQWGADALSKTAPPITGSVSRTGSRDWVMRVFNNSPDTYSVSVEVVQMGRGAKRLKSDNYSYTLKGKAKIERQFNTNQNVTDCSLNLTRWKNLTGKKKVEPALTPGVTPGAVVAPKVEEPVVAEEAAEPVE